MPHGADLLRCLERVRSAQNTEESTSCTLSIKIEPDTRGLDPAIHVFVPHESKTWMPGSSPGMTEICANLSPPSLRAKRSNPWHSAGMDGLLRRFAPLRKRFAFVAGNDVPRPCVKV